MMVRIILAFAICGTALAATPASAQNANTDAAPTILLAPSPAPYDSTTGSIQTPAATEVPAIEGKAPEALPVESAPPNAAAAEIKQSAPSKPSPLAEGKAPETVPIENAPRNGAAAERKQTVPPKPAPVVEGKAPESLPVESVPQNGAVAEGKPAENTEARFTFSRMNDGYVRLDNRTGQVSFCSKRSVGWTCQLAPEDRGVLENEIARLQEENVALKKEFLARGLPLPGSIKSDPPSVAQNERPSTLPSDPNIERMKVMVETAWRRLVDMISALQKEVLKKS
ncbi:MAG TPA: hypothetical protein VFK79_10180 [Xanthobacteraceae bacterium]|nr:hypothetical protein [Xanthobacteraceae bacterium]